MANNSVIITSEKQPQKGQDHRSSNNFTTEQFGKDSSLVFRTYYDYGTGDQKVATDITYDIKVDKTGKDTTYLSDVRFGECKKNTDNRNLYIADPQNAEKEFTVVVEMGVCMKSEKSALEGQKDRSSENFSTKQFEGKKVIIKAYYDFGKGTQKFADKVTFDIKEDKPVLSDPTLLKNVGNGTTDSSKITGKKNVYIANPTGAEDSFTVVITEAED